MLESGGGILASEGAFGLNEDVICIYADLDSLLERCELSEWERITVGWLMQGYTLFDIAEKYGKTRQNFEILLKRAVKKVVRRNNLDWEEWREARFRPVPNGG